MRRGSQFSNSNAAILPLTPVVKVLAIICLVAWFFLQVVGEGYFGLPVTPYFSLIPGRVLLDFYIWQLVTYMFLHSLQVTHILFNLLTLWFMGSELEMRWGPRYFLGFFLGSGAGAAVFYCLGVWAYTLITDSHLPLIVPVVGASGAIFGLMVAYGVIFGDRMVHLMMLFPIKAKYFVVVLGMIQVMSLLAAGVQSSNGGGEVAFLAHIGGLLSGFLILWGTAQWSRFSARRGNRKLKLVVNNEKKPKYWN